jgi:hypothetical protein
MGDIRRTSDSHQASRPLQNLLEPQVTQLLLHRIGTKTIPKVAEVDGVEFLILVEARKNNSLDAGDGVTKLLKALRTNLLHHALHRRIDAPNRMMLRMEQRLERAVTSLANRTHHAIAANRDDAVHLA